MAQRDASNPVRVLIVDDQPMVREAIASEFEPLTEFKVVGQSGSLAEARAIHEAHDVVILDLGLPDGSGADLIPELLAANPTAHVLVLTSMYDAAELRRAIELGAAAVLDKLTHLGRVSDAVRRLLAGERMMPFEGRLG